MFKNNFLDITVGMSPLKAASIFGTKATISTCGRTQNLAVVNTAYSFAVTYNNDLLFGLGECNKVDNVTIRWTNGETMQIKPNKINQYISIK
jgi:hypothetical protein